MSQELTAMLVLDQTYRSCRNRDPELGPLDLDLLGLVVRLDTVYLNIAAESGPAKWVLTDLQTREATPLPELDGYQLANVSMTGPAVTVDGAAALIWRASDAPHATIVRDRQSGYGHLGAAAPPAVAGLGPLGIGTQVRIRPPSDARLLGADRTPPERSRGARAEREVLTDASRR